MSEESSTMPTAMAHSASNPAASNPAAPNPSRTNLTLTTPDHAARNRRVIWLLLAASFVVILNETIMSVALKKLSLDLGVDMRAAQWLTTAFMLTMAVVIPITGFLLQRFHTRQVFIAAMTLFSTGTLLAALSPGFEMLVGARVVQACGTALMVPLLMTTLMTLVPPAERGKMMGNVSIVISVAPAIGPTISGIILNSLNWRWMFWLVLPVAVAMLVIGIRRVQNVTEPKPVPIDVVSVALSAVGFGGFIFGLSSMGAAGEPGEGASSAAILMWSSLGTGAAALAAFVWRQLVLQRRDRALLDLRTFRFPVFSATIITMMVSMVALFGTVILLPIYMQSVLGLEPVQVGLALLPGGLTMGVLAPLVGRIYDRAGPRVLLIPGTVIVCAVMWGLSTLGEGTPVALLVVAHVVLSVGLALSFTPLFTAGLGALPPSLYSHGSAIVGTVQQVAGAAGTALFVTLMSAQAARLAVAGASESAAAAGGVRAAFVVGAVIAVGAIVSALFVRKPADTVAELS